MSRRPALDLLASLVLEDGRRWGAVARDFQWADARAILALDSPTPYSFIGRPRGASKTGDLAGLVLGAMLCQLPPGARCYAASAGRDQSRLLIDSIQGYVQRTSGLAGEVDVQTYAVVIPATGVRLEALSADAPTAWGLRPAFVVVDELSAWHDTPAARSLWVAITSAMAKVAGARMAVITSAGDPAHWSHAILEHAEADPLWRVSHVDGPTPWADPERIAEQERRLTPSQYARLHLNRWTSGEDRLASAADLAACTVLSGPLAPEAGKRYYVGLDIGITNDLTAAAVAHAETGPSGTRIVLDRLQTWRGSRERPVDLSEVEAWLALTSRAYGRAKVVYDPYQSILLSQRLGAAGVPTEQFVFSAASVGRISMTMFNLIRDHALALPDDPDLLDELANVSLVERTPGVFRMDHAAGRHDDRCIAVSLAAHALLNRPPATVTVTSYRDDPPPPSIERGGLVLRGEKYLDRQPDGSLLPPPGFTRKEVAR